MFPAIKRFRQSIAKVFSSIAPHLFKKGTFLTKIDADKQNAGSQELTLVGNIISTVSFSLESRSIFAWAKIKEEKVISFEIDNKKPHPYRLEWSLGEPLRQYSSVKSSERSPYGVVQSSLEQMSSYPIETEVFECLSLAKQLSEEQKHFISEMLLTFNKSLLPQTKVSLDGEYFSLFFNSTYEKNEILMNLNSFLPQFQWRGGDSDSSGPYISSFKQPDEIHVQIYLDDQPISCRISFRCSWIGHSDRGDRIAKQVQELRPILVKAISPDLILRNQD